MALIYSELLLIAIGFIAISFSSYYLFRNKSAFLRFISIGFTPVLFFGIVFYYSFMKRNTDMVYASMAVFLLTIAPFLIKTLMEISGSAKKVEEVFPLGKMWAGKSGQGILVWKDVRFNPVYMLLVLAVILVIFIFQYPQGNFNYWFEWLSIFWFPVLWVPGGWVIFAIASEVYGPRIEVYEGGLKVSTLKREFKVGLFMFAPLVLAFNAYNDRNSKSVFIPSGEIEKIFLIRKYGSENDTYSLDLYISSSKYSCGIYGVAGFIEAVRKIGIDLKHSNAVWKPLQDNILYEYIKV
ncbi:hypothetical protein HY989_05500 [Candidatus Micrarchaeota archaeon]|nr:hypothetical protein [Candidatus Micrarchaeota archaeon]